MVTRVQTYRDEQIRHKPLILLPALAILLPASLNISECTMDDHARKEHGVEPREWAVESGDEAPGIGEEEVACIVDLAGISVPSVSQDRVTCLGLDYARVLNSLPWELREGLPLQKSTTLLGAEAVLLGIGGVPDPVYKQVGDKENSHEIRVPAICGWRVVGKVQGAVAVAQGDSSQVPENQHKAPFLIVHVPRVVRSWSIFSLSSSLPCGGDALFALGASICI
jgi:hypothetical protein